MYETIYYNVVQKGVVLQLKKKKKTVHFGRTLDFMFFYITQNNKDDF